MKALFHNHRSTIIALLPLLAAFALWLVHTTLGHHLITQAYQGTSVIDALNRAIAGQALYPLAYYLEYADVTVARALLYALMGCYIALVGYAMLRIGKTLWQYAATLVMPVVICAGIAAILVTLWRYTQYTVNIPCEDDIFTSLQFLINFEDARSMTERGEILLRSRSSHIIVFSNVTNILYWNLFGTLDFRHLMQFGFLFLLAVTVLLQMQFRGPDRGIHAVTVALLCINCLSFSPALMAIAALEYYPVLALSAAALLLLSTPGYVSLYLPALMVTLATFSLGNGMFGFVAGAAVLAIRNEKRMLFGWCIWAAIIVSIFFHLFEAEKTAKLARGLALNPQDLCIYYVTLLGSIAQVIPVYGARLAPFLGAILLALCIFLLQKKYYQKNPFIAGLILFILMTAAVITVGRSARAAIDSAALTPRFALHSCVLVALFYVALIESSGARAKRWHTIVFCLIALLLNIFAMRSLLPLYDIQQKLLLSSAGRYTTQDDLSGMIRSKNRQQAYSILSEASKRNIYNMATALEHRQRE